VSFETVNKNAELNHFSLKRRVAMEGTATGSDLFQWIQARTMHDALHKSAARTDPYPNGCDTSSTAGLKMNARISNAAVVL